MRKFLNEFKIFISRGNVMDMAVGIIIGGAFTSIVTSLVNDIINPVLGLFGGMNFAWKTREKIIVFGATFTKHSAMAKRAFVCCMFFGVSGVYF